MLLDSQQIDKIYSSETNNVRAHDTTTPLFVSISAVRFRCDEWAFACRGTVHQCIVFSPCPQDEEAWGEPQFKAELKVLQQLKKNIPRIEKATALFINQVSRKTLCGVGRLFVGGARSENG